MSAAIKLFFFRSKTGVPNFGDELSADTVAFVTGRPIQKSGRWFCELTGIGSILDRYLSTKGRLVLGARAALGRPVHVWGSGLITPPKSAAHPALKILALRGALTREALSANPATPLGDPGLFVARMLERKISRQGIGIVPHYSDKADPMVTALSGLPGVRIVDVERGGHEVSAEIGSCAVILSSSLHGLIAADSFGIPNWRLSFGNRLKGGDFKFLDYASALGRTDIAARQLKSPEEVLLLARTDADQTYQANVDTVCTGLERALKAQF